MTPLEKAVQEVALELERVSTSMAHNADWQRSMAAKQAADHDELTKLRVQFRALDRSHQSSRGYTREIILVVVAAGLSFLASCGMLFFGG
jgi:hypothetical protein